MIGTLNNIISGYFSLLKNTGITSTENTENTGAFLPGQKLLAKVVAKDGDNYLLQRGNQRFLGLSMTPLTVGQELELLVAGNKEGIVWLKVIPPDLETANKESQNELEEIRSLAGKYGIFNEKEITEISNIRQGIPVDGNTAVKYLLDPHLLAAILLPEIPPDKNKGKFEVSRYKNSTCRQNVWEISMDLNMENLGLVEIMIRMVESQIFIQIWAEEAGTETIIRQSQHELSDSNLKVEIIPTNQGPLIYKEKENIDYRV